MECSDTSECPMFSSKQQTAVHIRMDEMKRMVAGVKALREFDPEVLQH